MKKYLLIMLSAVLLAACSNYGKKVKEGHIEVYYKSGITERQAQKTAKILYEADKEGGNEPNRKSFQLYKKDENIFLKMVVDEKNADKVPDESFIAIANLVSENVFDGSPVEMELTDNKFNPIRTIVNKKTNPDDINREAFGEKVTSGNTEVYYKGAPATEVQKLADYLNNYFNPESTYSFQLLKDDIENYTVKMVGNPDKIQTLPGSFFEELCSGICNDVLHVPSLTFEMTDATFKPKRTYNYPEDTGDPDRNN